MAINWANLNALENKQAIEAHLRAKLITGTNYGAGPEQWTLTELLHERSNHAELARQIAAGTDISGRPSEHGALKDETGRELVYKIRVLSRQACFQAADGKGINGWDPTCVDAENDNDEYCPGPDEPPVPGDEVWIKNGPITRDAVTGEPMFRRHRMAARARLEAELGRAVKSEYASYYWTKAKVDEDGCITLNHTMAVQLLSTRGKRLVMPQWGSGRKGNKNERRITNWLFEEVPPGAEAKSTTTRQRRKPPTDNPHAIA